MSEHIEGLNRNQTALFPQTLEDYVDKENPVRFIDAFVDSLNLEKLGFKHLYQLRLEDHHMIQLTFSNSISMATSIKSVLAENWSASATEMLKSCGS